MADMLRSQRWVKVSNTYAADYSGSHRGTSKKEMRGLVDEWEEEIAEEREQRASAHDDPQAASEN